MKLLLSFSLAALSLIITRSVWAFEYQCPGEPERCDYVQEVWEYCQGDLNDRWQDFRRQVSRALSRTSNRRNFCIANQLPLRPRHICEQRRISALDSAISLALGFLSDLKAECDDAARGESCRRSDRGRDVVTACQTIRRLLQRAPRVPYEYTARQRWLRAAINAIWKGIDSRCEKMNEESNSAQCCKKPAQNGAPAARARFSRSELEQYLASLSSVSELSVEDRKVKRLLQGGRLPFPGVFPSVIGGEQCDLSPDPTATPAPSATVTPAGTAIPTVTVTPARTPTVTATPQVSVTVTPEASVTVTSDGFSCFNPPPTVFVVSRSSSETCYRVPHRNLTVCCTASVSDLDV